jgi:hypothetical protein
MAWQRTFSCAAGPAGQDDAADLLLTHDLQSDSKAPCRIDGRISKSVRLNMAKCFSWHTHMVVAIRPVLLTFETERSSVSFDRMGCSQWLTTAFRMLGQYRTTSTPHSSAGISSASSSARITPALTPKARNSVTMAAVGWFGSQPRSLQRSDKVSPLELSRWSNQVKAVLTTNVLAGH